MKIATPLATAAATALIANASVYACSCGRPLSAIVYEVRSAAPIWPPMTPPTVRMTVFMPVAIPVSVGLTLSVMRAAIAANADATPAPSTAIAAITCNGWSCHAASASAAIATRPMPSASGHFDP